MMMGKGSNFNIRKRVLLVIFLLQALIQPVYSSAKYTWPLFPRLLNYETEYKEYVNSPLCSVKGPKHPDTGFESLRMLGQSIHVENHHAWDRFSVIASVFLTNDEGTIFQIKQNQSEEKFSYIGLFYNTTNMYVQSIDDESNVEFTVTSDVPINKNEWVIVSVLCDKDEVELTVGENITGPVIIQQDVLLMFPGQISIGRGFLPGSVDATGLVTCIQIYETMASLSHVASSLDDCHRFNWPSDFLDALHTIVNSGSCRNDTGHYTLVYRDYEPDSQTTSLDQRIVTSKLRCASLCSHNATCISFTYTSLTHTCGFYSNDMSFSLSEEVGTDYYVKSYLQECC